MKTGVLFVRFRPRAALLATRLQVEDAFFEGGDARVGVGVAGLQAVHAGEVAARESFQASEDSGLHGAGGFLGAGFDSLFGGGDDGRDLGEVFGCEHWRFFSFGCGWPLAAIISPLWAAAAAGPAASIAASDNEYYVNSQVL